MICTKGAYRKNPILIQSISSYFDKSKSPS
jgi:hypothetical protein